jgi:hypothetical protein
VNARELRCKGVFGRGVDAGPWSSPEVFARWDVRVDSGQPTKLRSTCQTPNAAAETRHVRQRSPPRRRGFGAGLDGEAGQRSSLKSPDRGKVNVWTRVV